MGSKNRSELPRHLKRSASFQVILLKGGLICRMELKNEVIDSDSFLEWIMYFVTSNVVKPFAMSMPPLFQDVSNIITYN